MEIEETALELIPLTYDAALASQKWPAFMERLARATGSCSAMLREVDYDSGSVGLFETAGFDPAHVAAYRAHFVHLDIFASSFASTPIGTFMTGDEAVPWEQQRKSEFYNDYMLTRNIRHLLGGPLARDKRHMLQVGLQREPAQGEFGERDRRLLHLLAPHVVRAAHIHHQIAEIATQKHWALSALDHLRIGVILLDGRGRPLFLNRAAERLAAGRHGFVAGRDGLALASAAETACLRRLIGDAATSATERSSAAGGSLRIRKTLQFQVIPLPRDLSERPWEQCLPGSSVAVFVSAPGESRLPWYRIAAMHNLTRAEAKLASLLAEGISLEEAAKASMVSIQTVRSQLKSVFAKTGVKRQAELVALLLADILTDQDDGSLESA